MQYASSQRKKSLQKCNKPGPSQMGALVMFLKYAMDIFIKLLPISQCRKIPHEVRLILGYHFFPNWKQKKSFFQITFERVAKCQLRLGLAKLIFLKRKLAVAYPSTESSFRNDAQSRKKLKAVLFHNH